MVLGFFKSKLTMFRAHCPFNPLDQLAESKVKKVVSNIVPVLPSVCWMRSVYHTQYSVLQDLFVKFLSMWYRKCYNIDNISKILRRMNVNAGDFILRWYSGGISFQNTSPVEKNEDNLMLTWNSGCMNFMTLKQEFLHQKLLIFLDGHQQSSSI
jgi:hypothetical protein